VFLLVGGRLIRHEMLIGPSGKWREHLWLDALLEGPATAQASQKKAKPVLTSPLPINSCSVDSLTLLPGVGPVLAGRIADARREGLIFGNAEDLRRVKGIGPALSARLDTLVQYTKPVTADSLSDQTAKSR